MDTNDEVTRYERALAALRHTARVCAECGVEPKAGIYVRPGDNLLNAAVTHAEQVVASARRRALPIALGDEVIVRDVNAHRRGTRTYRVTGVGRTLVKINDGGPRDGAFRLDDGVENDGYGHRVIIPDDLARIKRDLVKRKETSR